MTCRMSMALAVGILGLSLSASPTRAQSTAPAEAAAVASTPAAAVAVAPSAAASAAPSAAAAKPAASAPASAPKVKVVDGVYKLGYGNWRHVVLGAVAALMIAVIYYVLRGAGLTEKSKDEGGQ